MLANPKRWLVFILCHSLQDALKVHTFVLSLFYDEGNVM